MLAFSRRSSCATVIKFFNMIDFLLFLVSHVILKNLITVAMLLFLLNAANFLFCKFFAYTLF